MTDTYAIRPGSDGFLRAVLLGSAISLAAALSAVFVLQSLGKVVNGVDLGSGYAMDAFTAGVIGPLFETALMAAMISLLFQPLLRRDIPVILATALCWSLFHGLFGVYWGVVAFIPFLVFSLLYLKFLKYGFRWAFAAAWLSHAIHNFVVVTLEYL